MLSFLRLLLCLVLALQASAGALLYETNENGNTTGIYTTGGAPLGALDPAVPFSTPYVLVSDGSGDVYVSDYSNGRVLEFSPAGAQIASFTAGLGNPAGLALDAAGNLYVVDRSDGNILKYSGGSGSVIATIPDARGLAYRAGLLYTASSTSGDVTSFGPDGSDVTTVVESLGSRDLRGVAFDSAGDLFISDSAGGTIYELAAGAQVPSVFASGLDGPEYLAIDSDGTFYVPEYFGGDVREIGPSGLDSTVLIPGLDHPSSVAIVDTPEPGYWGTGALVLLSVVARRGSR
jgi:sugar lactone lactonase YvrE